MSTCRICQAPDGVKIRRVTYARWCWVAVGSSLERRFTSRRRGDHTADVVERTLWGGYLRRGRREPVELTKPQVVRLRPFGLTETPLCQRCHAEREQAARREARQRSVAVVRVAESRQGSLAL